MSFPSSSLSPPFPPSLSPLPPSFPLSPCPPSLSPLPPSFPLSPCPPSPPSLPLLSPSPGWHHDDTECSGLHPGRCQPRLWPLQHQEVSRSQYPAACRTAVSVRPPLAHQVFAHYWHINCILHCTPCTLYVNYLHTTYTSFAYYIKVRV